MKEENYLTYEDLLKWRAEIIISEANNISLEEVDNWVKKSKIILSANDNIKGSFSLQVAYLTAVNAGKRVFKGGVLCKLPESVNSLLPFEEKDFRLLVAEYGGNLVSEDDEPNFYKITFGYKDNTDKSVELICNEWQGGINVSDGHNVSLKGNGKVPFGGITASSIAIFHAFVKYFKIPMELPINSYGISTWNLQAGKMWFETSNNGPSEFYLPKKLWIVGLGHLGQAYIWTYSFLPRPDKYKYEIMVQDYDFVGEENFGTQVLTKENLDGVRKTRICATYIEKLGFGCRIIEKPFTQDDQINKWSDDFKVILLGVDNIKTRRDLLIEKFDIVLDGATNGSFNLFDSFTLQHLTRRKKSPAEIWSGDPNKIVHKNMSNQLEKKFGCGSFDKSLSTPFVGLLGSSIMISELIRSVNGYNCYESISLLMRNFPEVECFKAKDYSPDIKQVLV